MGQSIWHLPLKDRLILASWPQKVHFIVSWFQNRKGMVKGFCGGKQIRNGLKWEKNSRQEYTLSGHTLSNLFFYISSLPTSISNLWARQYINSLISIAPHDKLASKSLTLKYLRLLGDILFINHNKRELNE